MLSIFFICAHPAKYWCRYGQYNPCNAFTKKGPMSPYMPAIHAWNTSPNICSPLNAATLCIRTEWGGQFIWCYFPIFFLPVSLWDFSDASPLECFFCSNGLLFVFAFLLSFACKFCLFFCILNHLLRICFLCFSRSFS